MRRRHTVETYDRQIIRRLVVIPCKGCGKKLRRTLSDWYTLNPHNQHTEKECRERIVARFAVEVAKMEADGVLCKRCTALQATTK